MKEHRLIAHRRFGGFRHPGTFQIRPSYTFSQFNTFGYGGYNYFPRRGRNNYRSFPYGWYYGNPYGRLSNRRGVNYSSVRFNRHRWYVNNHYWNARGYAAYTNSYIRNGYYGYRNRYPGYGLNFSQQYTSYNARSIASSYVSHYGYQRYRPHTRSYRTGDVRLRWDRYNVQAYREVRRNGRWTPLDGRPYIPAGTERLERERLIANYRNVSRQQINEVLYGPSRRRGTSSYEIARANGIRDGDNPEIWDSTRSFDRTKPNLPRVAIKPMFTRAEQNARLAAMRQRREAGNQRTKEDKNAFKPRRPQIRRYGAYG